MAFSLPKPAEAKKPKRAVKGKAFKAAAGARHVLFLGDEGAILVYMKGNAVLSRQFVPDASAQNLREFQQTLYKDIDAPLMLVIDSMDQSYMQQTLPPVSTLSVNKLIRRRLERDFSGNDIKGAILLGREKTGRRDWNFLMVALERSPQLSLWLEFIQEMPNRFAGIYLASIEAETLLKHLDAALHSDDDDGEPVEWKFFVSHNKVGGFRQVILRNDRIVFTRLAQPVGESSAEVIAGSIEQEMLSTIEYMKRLSFSPQSKLAIYIVTSNAIKDAIDKSKFEAHAFHIFTPYEVAEYLKLQGAAQPTDQFGDVVLAATIGCSKKHVLRLVVPQTRRLEQLYQAILYQRLLGALLIIGALGYAGYVSVDLFTLSGEINELDGKQETEKQALATLRREIASSNIDVEKASDLIHLYQQLQAEKSSPLPAVRRIGDIAPKPLWAYWIKSFEWSTSGTAGRARVAPGMPSGGGDSPLEMTIMFEFPQEAGEAGVFKAISQKMLTDIQEQFKGFDVRYVGLADPTNEVEHVKIRPDETGNGPARSLNVQVSIKGDMALLSAKPDDAAPPVATSSPAIRLPAPAEEKR